jgi:hypothetical protein
MKTKSPLLIAPILLIVFLAACAPQATPQAAPVAPVVEEPAANDSSAPTEMATPLVEEKPADAATVAPPAPAPAELDVEALIAEKVAGNHDLNRIFNAQKTREEWSATLDRMIRYGAKISLEEKEIIINYLLSRK